MIKVDYAVLVDRRRAPALLKYKLSYTSFLMKKSRKEADANPVRARGQGRGGVGLG